MGQFGIYSAPPLDVAPGAVVSTGPPAGSFESNKPEFALAGIGQGNVFTTPLQMGLVAAGIANKGVIMQPHVGHSVTDDAGKPLETIAPKVWKRATSEATAAQVRDYMVQVVNSGKGTGTAARLPGVTVAGKTGTAQTTEGAAPHAWFVAFAPAEAPQYAVSVIVEHGGNLSNEATGGRRRGADRTGHAAVPAVHAGAMTTPPLMALRAGPLGPRPRHVVGSSAAGSVSFGAVSRSAGRTATRNSDDRQVA